MKLSNAQSRVFEEIMWAENNPKLKKGWKYAPSGASKATLMALEKKGFIEIRKDSLGIQVNVL